MIRLTELAVAKRSVTLLITLGLLLGGVFAWASLKQELLPDIQFPYAVVITPLPGASAQDVSTQVTQPVERSIGSVPRLKTVSSSSVNSLSIVVASFSYGTNIKDTVSAIDANVKALGLSSTSTVQSFDINAFPPLVVAIRSKPGTTPEQLNALAVSTIVPSLQSLEGVSKADLTGATQYRLVVKLNSAKLAAAQVSLKQIQDILTANNLVLPAGSLPVTTGGSTISIPVSAQHQLLLNTPDDILNLAVTVKLGPDGKTPVMPLQALTLRDLGATVQHVAVNPTGYAELNSDPQHTDAGSSLIISVSKTSDANTVDVVQQVKDKLAKLQAQNGGSFEVVTVEDFSTFIIESRDSLVREGGLGALFAIITIFVFLLSLRSTLVAAVSIPVSIMTALVLMLVAGVSINIMTLGGLAIAVGRVVDDAIVVLENIYRHRSKGDPMRVACISGTREVARAITSSTLTTVAVFLPLGFVGGIVSQFFLPFALTVTFALLASLVCALTVVPVLASLFMDRLKLNPDEGPKHHDTLVQRAYTPLLKAALHNRRSRWSVIGIAALLVFGAALLVPHIPTQFLNTGSQKYLQITVAPPSGTSSSVVLEQAKQVEAKLRTYSEVNLIETTVPSEADTGLSALAAAFTGGASNSATVVVRFDPSTNLDTEQKKLSDALAGLQPDQWQIQVAQQTMTGSGAMSVVVSGAKPADVVAATQAVTDELKKQSDLINVKSDLATKSKQYDVDVDPTAALLDGSTTYDVQTEVHAALVGSQVGTVSLDGAPVEVYLQLDTTLGSLDDLKVMPVGKGLQPLGQIATVQEIQTQARISRVDQSPAATITADSTSKDTGGVSMEIQKAIDKLQAEGKLNGVTVRLSGVTSEMNEAFSGLYVSMAVAILLVYIVMVLVFNSLVDPLVIMFSLPLATIGAFPALFLTQRAIGVSALIGFLMLIGIVVTNAIVLLDLVEQHRHRGMPMYEALMQGGRTRVRPILMTAIATILALIPLGLGLSEGEIIASELATVVIGGLFTSTFLTLIIIPVVYSLVEDGKVRVGGWFGGAGEHDELEAKPTAS